MEGTHPDEVQRNGKLNAKNIISVRYKTGKKRNDLRGKSASMRWFTYSRSRIGKMGRMLDVLDIGKCSEKNESQSVRIL